MPTTSSSSSTALLSASCSVFKNSKQAEDQTGRGPRRRQEALPASVLPSPTHCSKQSLHRCAGTGLCLCINTLGQSTTTENTLRSSILNQAERDLIYHWCNIPGSATYIRNTYSLTLTAQMDCSKGWKSLKQNPSFFEGRSMSSQAFRRTVPTHWPFLGVL